MISMEYLSITRTERTRKRENFWIFPLATANRNNRNNWRKILRNLIPRYFFLLLCVVSIPKTRRGEGGGAFVHFHESVEGKPALKRIPPSSPSRGGIENRFKTTRHARKSILHARCAPRIIGNWNFTVGRRLAWHLTAISPHRYVLSPA